MTKNGAKLTHAKHQQPKENSTNMPNIKDKETKQIKELKLKYLSLKESEYGHNHMFAVLDETPLKELTELSERESATRLKMPIWEYYDKYYLKIKSEKVKEAQVEFQKDVPYIMDLTFSKYDFQKGGEQIKGYTISEINKIS